MQVLVTGATGFIGRHVVAELLARGHAVTALARDESRARRLEWFERVDFVASDIHAPDAGLEKRIGRPDAVVHLAWPGLPNYQAPFHFEENLPACYRFLESLVEMGIGQIFVAGTCLEYGMRSGRLSEDMATEPVTSYARAKDALRKRLQQLQQRHPFILQWARLFFVYGEGQSPDSLLAQLDRSIEAGESSFDMSGGEQLRDYLPAESVASSLVSLLEHSLWSGVVNVCSGKPISVRRLVETHLANRNAILRLNVGQFPYRDYEPMAFWGDRRLLDTILAGA